MINMKYIFYFNDVESVSGSENCYYVLTSSTYEDAVKEAFTLVENMNIYKDDELIIAELNPLANIKYRLCIDSQLKSMIKNENGKKSKSNKSNK
jgi:hypothetical protein